MDKFFVICATNDEGSSNYLLANRVKDYLTCKSWFPKLDTKIPYITNSLLDCGIFPETLSFLYEQILVSECLIFVSPEHNWNFPAFFKGIVDWISVKKKSFFENKKVFVISASQTKRVVRQFEVTSRKTFECLGCKNFHFINWNSEVQSSEKLQEENLKMLKHINE